MSDALTSRGSFDHAEAGYGERYEPSNAGSLSKAQGLQLLTRLVQDDGFRARFESAPAAAFAEIGISEAQMSSLKEACLQPRSLAPRHVLEVSLQWLAADVDTSTLALMIPTLKV
jgi:putative modified peptide